MIGSEGAGLQWERLLVAEFGGVWVKRGGCGGPEWVDSEGSEADIEGYNMEEGERGWREEARARSKLVMIGRLMDHECKARYVEVDCTRQGRVLVKLRGRTAELRIETGRWRGWKREERICKNCRSGELEDIEHLVIRCEQVKEERGKLMELMD